MARTIDQQIADAQAKLARLKIRQKASDTRRKIIVGAIVTTEALKDPKISKWLASTLGVCCRTGLNPTLSPFRPSVFPREQDVGPSEGRDVSQEAG